MPADTIVARLFENARRQPQAPAYHVRANGQWVATSWAEYAAEVRQAANALIALGFAPGQTVCILGFNRPEWAILDLGAMAAGGAPAGIYTTCSPSEVAYIIGHSEAPLVLVENLDQWEKVRKTRDQLPHLRHVVLMRGAPKVDDPMVMGWDAFLSLGEAGAADAFEARLEALKDDDLATLIYTSGTTGPPKGVMLSHRNLAWTAGVARDLANITPEDASVSYLPLSHIAEQMFTLHVPATCGSQIYYAESVEKVLDNLKEVQPTVVFAVPRVWEKMHAGITAKLAEASGVKAHLLAWARGVGTQVAEVRNRGGAVSGWLGFQYDLATKAIFSKVKPALGLGRARFCVSGAAPIAREVIELFASLDLRILEVYGQSEGSGPTTFNRPDRARFGSVGPALPGVEVRIAEDGEILVKGPNVFLGYYKDPAATAETLKDGWLHSGDLGSFDAEGFLHITGRKKEILITAGGKNIAPKNLEAAIKNHPLVGEAVVIGDRRKYLTALVTLEPEAAAKLAAAEGVTVEALATHPAARAQVQSAVDALNADVARVEAVKKFTILPRPFTVDGGELTPTLKIKRKVIYQKYAAEIDAMYADDGA